MYGKATENAIAAMTRLAEVYDGGETRLSASDIATTRGLQRPFVAKLLSVLAIPSLTVTVTLWLPAVVGEPLIRPLPLLILNPVGKPLAA